MTTEPPSQLSLSTGALIGTVIGVLLLLTALVVLALFLCSRNGVGCFGSGNEDTKSDYMTVAQRDNEAANVSLRRQQQQEGGEQQHQQQHRLSRGDDLQQVVPGRNRDSYFMATST